MNAAAQKGRENVDRPLVAEDVGRRYSRRQPWALRHVSVSIPSGSITALVGPNGAGKSTLLRSWVGFEAPNEGRVLVEGVDPTRARATAVLRIGFVPQSTSLYRGLTVDEHFRLATVDRARFDRSFAIDRARSVGIDERRRIGELSGGEQAQVALALALAARTPILLLDEPLASLDPLARREFLTVLVTEVRASGATAILSSHIVSDIEEACDRLLVLAAGRVALDASVARVLGEHRTVADDHLDGREPVASFSGPGGDRLVLVRTSDDALRPATLEEVVLGYLARSREPSGVPAR